MLKNIDERENRSRIAEIPISFARIHLFVLLLIYCFVLVILYRLYIVTYFFEYPDLNFSMFRAFEAVLMALIASTLVPTKWSRPSYFYFTILIVAVFLPMCVIYLWSEQDRAYFYMVALTILFIRFVLTSPSIHLKKLIGCELGIEILFFILISALFAYLIHINKGHFNFSLTEVYDQRAYFRNVISGGWGYLLPWVGKIIIPMIIGYFLWDHKYWHATFFLGLGFLLFPLSSHKLYVIFTFFPVVLYFLFRWKHPTLVLIVLVMAGLVGAVMMMYFFDNIWGIALLLQRGTFKPALLNFTYVAVFKHLKPVMLANSGLFPLIKYPYDVNPAFMVGEFLRGSIETRSNTGFLGTGYAHFGLFGPFFFGMIVTVILKVLDAISKNIPVWVACVISLGPFSSMLIMADLLPSLATHGVVFCLAILWLGGNLFRELPETDYGAKKARPIY